MLVLRLTVAGRVWIDVCLFPGPPDGQLAEQGPGAGCAAAEIAPQEPGLAFGYATGER